MSTLYFKTHIKNLRKEMIKNGYSISTIKGYEVIWNNYIKWTNKDLFIYNKDSYSKFLLEYYNFDINTYTNKSKSFFLQLMRSKRILDNFDDYKIRMNKRMFTNVFYSTYPDNWNDTITNYIDYCKNVRQNSSKTINLKEKYIKRELSYFHNKGLLELNNFSINIINNYINDTIKAGDISKRRNFFVLKDFLSYLFIEDIMDIDLSIFIPKTKRVKRKKIPIY